MEDEYSWEGIRLGSSATQGLVYIGQSVHHEPLDQTDLKDGIDAT
jgi:hypothetical protein